MLLENETVITRSKDNTVTITQQRVFRQKGKDFTTISMDKISCVRVRYFMQIIFMIIGILAILVALLGAIAMGKEGPDDELVFITATSGFLGFTFTLIFLLTRKHVVNVVSDSGVDITFSVGGADQDEIIELVNTIDRAKIDFINRAKSILAALLFLSANICIASSYDSIPENYQLAKVKVVDSVEIYMMCEPLRNYKVVGDVLPFSTSGMASHEKIIRPYIARAKKKGYKFDALIIQDDWRAYVVQWKE